MLIYVLQIPFILYCIEKIELKYSILYNGNSNKKKMVDNTLGIYHSLYLSISSSLYLIDFISIDSYDIILFHSVIYNFNDLIKQLMYKDNKMKYEMIIHHIILILSCLSKHLINFQLIYYFYISSNFLSEISTPTLNLSQILYLNKKTKSILFKLSIITTLVTFFIFRVLLQFYLIYMEIHDNELNSAMGLTFKISFYFIQILLWLLNCYWFKKIVKLVIKNI